MRIIDSQTVIELCQKATIMTPQIEDFVIAEVKAGGRIHAKFEDDEAYVVFTENEIKKPQNGRKYRGGIYVFRQGDHYRIEFFSIRAHAIVLTDIIGDAPITEVGGSWSNLIWDEDPKRFKLNQKNELLF